MIINTTTELDTAAKVLAFAFPKLPERPANEEADAEAESGL